MLRFNKRKNYRFVWIFVLTTTIMAAALSWFVFLLRPAPVSGVRFGVTFSQKYANELGLEWMDVYSSILEDLHVKRLRLPVYWDLVEPGDGEFDFRDLDFQLEKAREHNAEVILVIGHRVPRWPECHAPAWTFGLSEKSKNEKLLRLLNTIVVRYRDNKSIRIWQVENEPFLEVFGLCPRLDEKFLAREIDLVRSLDPSRPVMITESGELSTWLRGARLADIVGVSMYRTVWNRRFGYFYYPLTPLYYRYKASVIKQLGKRVFVSELQTEPWTANPIYNVSLEEQYRSMNLKRFKETIRYAQLTKFDEIYVWGAEWWYWMKDLGKGEIWDEAKKIF